MNLREAAKQALEALEDHATQYPHMQKGYTVDAITALRAALAENVPETNFGNITQTVDSKESDHVADTGKTSDQSEDARGMVATSQESRQVEPVATIKKMETVEPVAWLQIGVGDHEGTVIATTTKPKTWNPAWRRFEPLYTAPPKREPLTKEQLLYVYNQLPNWGMDMDSISQDLVAFARAIERAHGIGGEK